MTKLHLKYVQSFGGYHYFRRARQTRVRLPGLPGSAEFMQAYADALAAAPTPIGKSKRSGPGSISAAIAEYYGSLAFRNLTGGTPALRRAALERFRETHGDRTLATLPKEFLVALFDTMAPHTARTSLKALRHFSAWAVERKLMKNDPTLGIKIKLPKSDGYATWTEEEIAQFESAHPIGSKARLALALGLYTVQRREDVILIGRQNFRDGVLTVRPLKTRNTTNVTLQIPVLPQLHEILDATPVGHLTLLTTRTGKGYEPNDFTDQFGRWRDAAGLPEHCVFHGLRKAACRRFAEYGFSTHEIAAWSGHSSLKEIERYTRAVNQAKLARDSMAKLMPGEQNGTGGVKTVPAKVSKPLKALPKKAG
jgi:integrase